MRRGWLALALLAAMLGLAAWHVATLEALTGELAGELERAETLARTGDWTRAAQVTRQARETWRGRGRYLHITLEHEAVDQVDLAFEEALEFLRCREAGEYPAANARLLGRLALLSQQERPVLENLF